MVLCGLSSACTGKAILTSHARSTAESAAMDYALPKGSVHIKLLGHKANKSAYGLRVEGVSYIGDNDFQYTIRYDPDVFSADVVKITKNSDTSTGGCGTLEKG